MTEQLNLHDMRFTAEQAGAIEDVGRQALGVVQENFGYGYPDFRESGRNLAFHNGYHSFGVARDAEKMGAALGMSPAELAVTRAAALAHDIILDGPRGVMELESAAWFDDQAWRQGLPGVVGEAGRYAIVGTEPLFNKKGILVGQAVGRLIFPSKSVERIAKSVACGDLGEVYGPRGPLLSHKLYQEIKGVGPNDDPPMEDLLKYEEGQVAFREGYRYPLREARRVLATHRKEVMKYGEQVLKQLERGDITSWQQLEEQDLAFMRQHS